MFKGEVLVAAILQLTVAHTHICFVTTHVVARHAAAVSCISNVQSFTELTALTLNKSHNKSWDYGFSLPRQLKSRKLISSALFWSSFSAFRDEKRSSNTLLETRQASRNTLRNAARDRHKTSRGQGGGVLRDKP